MTKFQFTNHEALWKSANTYNSSGDMSSIFILDWCNRGFKLRQSDNNETFPWCHWRMNGFVALPVVWPKFWRSTHHRLDDDIDDDYPWSIGQPVDSSQTLLERWNTVGTPPPPPRPQPWRYDALYASWNRGDKAHNRYFTTAYSLAVYIFSKVKIVGVSRPRAILVLL